MISPSVFRSAAAAAVLLLALGACGSDDKKAESREPGAPGGSTKPASQTDKIEVKDFAFKPESTTVKVGTTVTWTFADSAAHNIDPVGGSEPKKSPDLKSGGTYTFTFAKAGTYNYRCGIHNSMTATIVVTA